MPLRPALRLLAPAVIALVVVAVGALSCGPSDEPPGEWRLCCEDGASGGGCPEDACPDPEAE